MFTAQRVFFLVLALIIYLGIFLTGYNNVHWFAYVPVALLLFAFLTGFCPGLKILKAIGLK